MKVLVTGGAGYIGSILVRKLLETGHDVVVVDRLAFGDESLRELEGRPGYRLVTGDIRDRDLVDASLRDREAVVHLAAIVGEAACAADPTLAIETNFEATRHLAEASAAAGIARFVFASTCSVYGTGLADRLSEESELAPTELYAESRVNAELALARITGARFRPTVLRFGTVYGYSPRTRFDLVVNLLTARALRPDMTVVARAETESGADRLRQAGASRVVSPYAIGGHRMAQAILRPSVLDFVDLATHHRSLELQIEEIPVGRAGSRLLGESELRENLDVMVIAIRKAQGELRFNPAPTEPLAQGDRLLVAGEVQSLKALEKKLG